MKYIKSYTIFEKASKSYDDSDFQLLSDILVSEVLDDMNIQYLDDDGEDEYFESKSKYPYWCYARAHRHGYSKDGTIRQISICNLSKSQATELTDKLRNDIFPFINKETGLYPECTRTLFSYYLWDQVVGGNVQYDAVFARDNEPGSSEDDEKAIINIYLGD